MKTFFQIPKWCVRMDYFEHDHRRNCCRCLKINGEYFQTGDGKFLHTLCHDCYNELGMKI